jgi:hypothetical protein
MWETSSKSIESGARMKKVTAAVLAAFQLASLTGCERLQAGDESEFLSAIGSMQHSVAPVMCMRAVQPQLQPIPPQQTPAPSRPGSQQLQPLVLGTAFFVTKRGDFVTSASVLANFVEPGPIAGCTMMVWFAGPVDSAGNFGSQAFTVALKDCVVEADIDVARCRTVGDLSSEFGGRFAPVPVAFDNRQPETGTAIGTTGYILYDNIPVASRAHVGAYQPAPPAARQMVIDRPSGVGASGSPVYDARGKVLGMVALVRTPVLTNISVATTSLAIAGFLAAHPIDNR